MSEQTVNFNIKWGELRLPPINLWNAPKRDRSEYKIITSEGNFVDPLVPESISIKDIVKSLRYQCRYTGHCEPFYSVLEHSVLVFDIVDSWLREEDSTDYRMLRTALLHDATEAYMNDVNRPTKLQLKDYPKFEDKLWKQIAKKFGLYEEIPSMVKEADRVACAIEMMSLLPYRGEAEGVYALSEKVDPDMVPFSPHGFDPGRTTKDFAEAFNYCTTTEKLYDCY